jgi:hypothetical protein
VGNDTLVHERWIGKVNAMTKSLTWDDLAEFYGKKTGGRAKIRPMDEIYEWATKQEEIQVNEDSSLSFKETALKQVKC